MGTARIRRVQTMTGVEQEFRDQESQRGTRLPVYDMAPDHPADGNAWIINGAGRRADRLEILIDGRLRFVDLAYTVPVLDADPAGGDLYDGLIWVLRGTPMALRIRADGVTRSVDLTDV